jgi:small conductance mechanosensitive channel
MKPPYSTYLKSESSWAKILDFCSGLLLKVSAPFKKEDIIEMNGSLGTVTHKGTFVFKIKTSDDKILSFSNRRVYTQGVNNLTAKNMIRLDFNIEVAYDANMNEVKRLLYGVLEKNEFILNSPTPKISIAKLKSQCINLTLSPWCEPDNYWSAYNALKIQIQEKLKSNSISSTQAKLDLVELRKVI